MTPSAYTCPQCGTPIAAGQPACNTCGLRLDPASLAAFYAQRSPQPSYPPAPPPVGYNTVSPVYTPPPPMAARRGGFPRWILFGVGGVLGLCVICGLIGALLNPRSTTTVYPPPGGAGQIVEQVTPTQVAVVGPRATTAPTDVPPTKAPPTDVPPTAVPVADTGMTAAEQSYILAVGDQTTRFSKDLSDLSEEMTNADLASADWILRTAVTVTSMNTIIDEAQQLDAPASLSALDASYQKAMAHFRKSTTALTQGITDAQNGQTSTATPLVTQASEELTAGSTEISTTGQLLNDFIAAHK